MNIDSDSSVQCRAHGDCFARKCRAETDRLLNFGIEIGLGMIYELIPSSNVTT